MSRDDKKTQSEQAEAAQWLDAEPKLRDVLKREYDEHRKGRPPNLALERWGEEIEQQILREPEETDLGPSTNS